MSDYKFEKFDKLSHIKFHSREVVHALQSYKEHAKDIMDNLSKEDPKDKENQFLISEKVSINERSIERIDIGIQEMDILMSLDLICNIVDAERVKTRLQVKRLVQENNWLRTELIDLQKRLVKLEESVVTAEAERQHYQYVYKMRNQQRNDEEFVDYLIDAEDDEDMDPEDEIPTKLKAVHNLCMEYIREKRYEVAIPLCEEHIQQIKSKQGENNNDIATLYGIIAKVHKEQGNLPESQKYYEDSLKLREKALGKDHNAVGITMTMLAHILYKRNNIKEAEKYATQALKIREKLHGKNNPEVALIHSHLGMYAASLEKWNDVINHYKTALSVYEQMFDHTDSLIIKGQSNMAKAYVNLKQNDKAAEMLSFICKSYQQKNTQSNKSEESVFQVLQQHAADILKDVTAEYLIKSFGSYENAIDRDVLETMIKYFKNINKPNTVEVLTAWIDSSEKQPNPVVRQSINFRNSKKGIPALEKKMSLTSQSSKQDKSSLMGFFKRDKKK